jgi:hypothetical protein
VSCFTIGKAHGWGTFLKRGAELAYRLVLSRLFWKCSHPRALPYTYSLILYCFSPLTSCVNQFASCWSSLCIVNLCFVLKSIRPTLFMELWDSKLHLKTSCDLFFWCNLPILFMQLCDSNLHLKTNCDLLFWCNFVTLYSFLLLCFWSFLV